MKKGLMHYQSFLLMERTGWKLNVEISPNCPRCGSSNTKFCYYNNYSLTQPRYFCKGCRRYWTKGGSLRNVPVGGGCRKNRRGKSIRLSTDIMSSRGFRGLTNHPQGVSHGSSSNYAPPNIDLSMVYANFLNPQPPRSNTSSGSEPQEPTTSNSGLCMDPATSSCMTTNVLDSNVGLPEVGHGLFRWDSLSDLFMDTHLGSDGSAALLFDHPTVVESLQNVPDDNKAGVQQCGTDDTSYYMLPPLPSDDIVSREMNASWTMTNPSLLVNDHSLQDPEQQVLRFDHQALKNEDPNILIRGSYDDQNQFNFSR